MNVLANMLSPLGMGSGAVQDTLKLVVIGGTMETARRVSVSAWNGFVDSFFLTATFSEEDYPYDWIMHWLSKQPAWGRSREFEITTRSAGRGMNTSTTADVQEEEEDEDGLEHGRKRRVVAFMPSLDTTHTIYYRGHWLRITRTKRYPDYGGATLKISVVARNNDILKRLVLEARKEYEKDAEHRVHIFLADPTYGCWRWNGARQKRPMSSIVLQPGVKEMLLADCKDFLCSEEWYAERGIPYRRGLLLHGVPGSGKTSLIHSLAGELGLDIYVVSLSAKGMSDNTLTTLMGNVPSRCIVLLEDLDAAFTRSVSRDSSSTGAPTSSSSTSTAKEKEKEAESDGSTLSLSGLLNSLDGVAAAEGRLLFATTNHIERLDPALSRPGRMDVWVNFSNATKWQAEGIFKCFFPSASVTPVDENANANKTDEQPSVDISQKNLPLPRRKRAQHAIPLLSESEINELAKRFAEAIPEDELSVAALQGYLLKNKTRPRECVDEVAAWVIQERETREKLKKEKAEREAKEKQETEEREKKEKEEKEAKEKEAKELVAKAELEAALLVAKAAASVAPKPEDLAPAPVVAAETPAADPSSTDSTPAPSPPAEAEPTLAPTPAPEPLVRTESTESTSSSSSDSETTSGAEADTESVTSEEETDATTDKKDKWVAVKSQQTATAPAETVPTSPEAATAA
ncbi:BCS1-N domain-containing protein [Mycena chlorophos]|uniref:BCS1-N domain-containing protein n=1 Tax=Mycena chlorophos TaxID=658473 RepID=A0A8H6S0N0_MYCCL|nr:BCS1-N domain-containing protein [Mycena chlorophos]